MFKVNNRNTRTRCETTTRGISDKVTPDIDFTDEAVVQFDVPVVRILL